MEMQPRVKVPQFFLELGWPYLFSYTDTCIVIAGRKLGRQ